MAWRIGDGTGGHDWPDYLRAAIAAGTGANGVFGLRLMWNMLGELVADLGGAAMHGQADLLGQTFGPVQFVHLTRRDLVAQAVSRHRAEVSGTWHLGIEQAARPAKPDYDRAAIAAYLTEAKADNAAWADWFNANRITPFCIHYEDLAADPMATARGVLSFLDLHPLGPLHAANRRMADATSLEWAARFRAEGLGNP